MESRGAGSRGWGGKWKVFPALLFGHGFSYSYLFTHLPWLVTLPSPYNLGPYVGTAFEFFFMGFSVQENPGEVTSHQEHGSHVVLLSYKSI